jgi:hypothetical protein
MAHLLCVSSAACFGSLEVKYAEYRYGRPLEAEELQSALSWRDQAWRLRCDRDSAEASVRTLGLEELKNSILGE